MNHNKVSIDFAIGIVGKWKDTYHWIPIAGAFTAIAMAIAAGSNVLPAPFSSPVGSGALTLLKASVMAFVIYVPGAGFASHSTVTTLLSDFLRENQPDEGFLMWSMLIVLFTATIWLALATYMELPVSSQQSTQGALLGTMLVTEGFRYMPMWNKNENHDFNGGGLLWIFLEWTIAPLIACVLAFAFFAVLKISLLRHENARKRILIFLPIDYGISAGLLCLFLMYQVIPNFVSVIGWIPLTAVALATILGALLSLLVVVPLAMKKLNINQHYKESNENAVKHDPSNSHESSSNSRTEDQAEFDEALKDFMQMRVLDTVYEEDERSWPSSNTNQDPEKARSICHSISTHSTPFKQLLESTPNRLVQEKKFQKIKNSTSCERYSFDSIRGFIKSKIFPVIEYDRHTLIRHALAEKYDEMEECFSFPLLLATCIFALIQSASDIAAVVSPYGAIHDVFKHRHKFNGNGEAIESIHVTWWFRAIGGFGAAMGFFLYGRHLTQCLGGKLTYMSNSRGLASQLSAVAAMILVTRIRLPVSSSHAFIGSLVGVGIADDPRNVNWKILLKFICGWILTIVFCCGVAYVLFSVSIHSPAYVIP